MENNTNISFRNGGDANVSINQIDYGGEIALKIVQAILGLIFFVIASPVLIPMMIAENNRERIGEQRRGLLSGGE